MTRVLARAAILASIAIGASIACAPIEGTPVSQGPMNVCPEFPCDDYAAPKGTPVVAANSGRVVLVADYFFPGRLVILDHGLGLYTLYFHLDSVGVASGDLVDRGQIVGTVGATGRATGPHLHFGALVGGARVNPAALMTLEVRE